LGGEGCAEREDEYMSRSFQKMAKNYRKKRRVRVEKFEG